MDKNTILNSLALASALGKIAGVQESYELGLIDAETLAARVGDILVEVDRVFPAEQRRG